MTATGIRVGTLNLASGRNASGHSMDADALRAAVSGVDADVLAVQEVDVGQLRSHRLSQPAELAAGLGAADWRFAASIDGTPDPFRSWQPAASGVLTGPGDAPAGPRYGIALFSRLPVRRWSVHPLGAGRARLPIHAPDPRTGQGRWWWFPDEPRLAVAAELDGCTVVGTHLSFAPHTAVRQLVGLRRWARTLPGPVVLAGDLNLAGQVPARLLGGTRLVSAPTYPGANPRLQYDHVLALSPMAAAGADVRALPVGDHRLVTVTVSPPPPPPLWR